MSEDAFAFTRIRPNPKFSITVPIYTTPTDNAPHGRHLPLTWKSTRQAAVAELQKHPNLQYTLFHTGYFLDYWGMPQVPSHMITEAVFIDPQHCVAAIPGTGEETVVFTYTKDVGKFVARSLDLEKWESVSQIAGDKFTFNEVVKVMERVRGTCILQLLQARNNSLC